MDKYAEEIAITAGFWTGFELSVLTWLTGYYFVVYLNGANLL